MEIILWTWVDFALRWLHVIAGIAWIGSSFYFVHLDSSLQRRPGLPDGAGGEAWQVHGGGFYNMVKYLVAPARMPDQLTWFKWEAYTTWISGFFLLVVLYYAGAELYLVDPLAFANPLWMAIALSLALLVLGWIVYDVLCKSPARRERGRPVGGGLRVPGGARLALHAAVQRPRRVHADGRFDRHDHGRQRLPRDHPEPEEGRGRPAGRPGARSGARRAGQAALDAQQLSDAAGAVPDDQQPLSDELREPLELADLRDRAGGRRGHPALLQRAPQGAAEPLVDLGRRGGGHGGDRAAERRRAVARRARGGAARAGGDLRRRRGDRARPLQHVPRRSSRSGRGWRRRPRASSSTTPC